MSFHGKSHLKRFEKGKAELGGEQTDRQLLLKDQIYKTLRGTSNVLSPSSTHP